MALPLQKIIAAASLLFFSGKVGHTRACKNWIRVYTGMTEYAHDTMNRE